MTDRILLDELKLELREWMHIQATFDWLRHKYPDDKTTWEAVRSLISSGALVDSSSQKAALAYTFDIETLRKELTSQLQDLELRKIASPPRLGDDD